MPKIQRKIAVPSRSAQDLYTKISGELDKMLSSLPAGAMGKSELTRDPATKTIFLKAPMMTGQLAFLEQSIELTLDLSFLATPFKSKIEAGLDQWISKAFPVGSPKA